MVTSRRTPWALACLVAAYGSEPALAAPSALFAEAQEEESPRPAAILLRAEHLIVRPGQVLDGGSVLVIDGVIQAVGAGLEAPEGAQVIEGHTVCAGFIDAWSALGLTGSALGEASTSAATRSADGLDVYSDRYLREQAVRAGILAARVQGGPGQQVGGFGAVTRLAPDLGFDDAMLLPDAGVAMALGLSRASSENFVPQPDGTWAFESGSQAMDPFDRLSGVERVVSNLEAGRSYLEDVIEYRYELEAWEKAIAESEEKLEKDFKKAKKDRDKEVADAEEKGKEFKDKKYKEDKKPREPRLDEDKAAFARVVDGEIPLVVEVHRAAEIRYLLEITKPYPRLRLVIAGGSEANLVAEELAERDVPVICWPALRGTEVSDEHQGPGLSLAAQLAEAGVSVLFGSGGRDPEATRDLPLLVQVAIGHGLDREQAFDALTLGAARAFDASDRLGSVEVGKEAELLVLSGAPLLTASRVTHAVSKGRVVAQPQE